MNTSPSAKPKQIRSKRYKYAKVMNEERHKLIDAVIGHGVGVQLAAENLGIKYSTAKTIIQIYKKTGRTERKECRYEFGQLLRSTNFL